MNGGIVTLPASSWRKPRIPDPEGLVCTKLPLSMSNSLTALKPFTKTVKDYPIATLTVSIYITLCESTWHCSLIYAN